MKQQHHIYFIGGGPLDGHKKVQEGPPEGWYLKVANYSQVGQSREAGPSDEAQITRSVGIYEYRPFRRWPGVDGPGLWVAVWQGEDR